MAWTWEVKSVLRILHEGNKGKKERGVEKIAQDTRGLSNLHTPPGLWNFERHNEEG